MSLACEWRPLVAYILLWDVSEFFSLLFLTIVFYSFLVSASFYVKSYDYPLQFSLNLVSDSFLRTETGACSVYTVTVIMLCMFQFTTLEINSSQNSKFHNSKLCSNTAERKSSNTRFLDHLLLAQKIWDTGKKNNICKKLPCREILKKTSSPNNLCHSYW